MALWNTRLGVCAAAASLLALPSATHAIQPDHSAVQVLDRYVQALGGAAPIDAIRTRVTLYTMSLGWRIKGTLEIRQMRPDRIIERGTASGWGWHGTFGRGFDGSVGWSGAPDQGVHPLDGRELHRYLLRSRLDRDAHLNEFYPIQVLRPDRQVTGRTYHVVELSGPFGAREIWYLDAITGLLVQMDSESDDDTGSGVHVVTTTFEDYRLVDAVRVPFRITRQDGKRNYSMTVTAIRNNVPLTLEDFAAAK